MVAFPKKLTQKLDERNAGNALRQLAKTKGLIDLSSNDYLGFAQEPVLAEKANQLMGVYRGNNGSGGSRLLTGNHPLYGELEELLCGFHKSGAALVFSSGYAANVGFFASVVQREDLIFYDEHCHASIRDGIRLSRARHLKFKHNDLEDLSKKVERNMIQGAASETYVVTEAVFSMDGDSPDLKQLASFCTGNKLHLVVDEAHAVGVFGKGLVVRQQLEEQVFARIITFGKALGAHGAAVLGSTALKAYLVNFARSLIYTTALPPHTLATVLAAYRLLDADFGRRQQAILKHNSTFFNEMVGKLELSDRFACNASAIQWCMVEGNKPTKKLALALQNAGFDVRPILSPTVPKGTERLRFCLHAFNTMEELEAVLKIVKNELEKNG